jgi:hypothetical protein
MVKGRASRKEAMPNLPKWYLEQQKAKGTAIAMPALDSPHEIPVGSLLMLYAGATNTSKKHHPGRSVRHAKTKRNHRGNPPSPLLSRLMEECCKHDSLVVDPGCLANVGGEEWLARASRARGPFRIVDEERDFTFGAGLSVSSIKCVAIPCLVAGKELYIKFFIVPGVLPPLLSKSTMKRMGDILNMVEDTLSGSVSGSSYSFPLVTSDTGHYLVHLPRMPLR